MNKTAEQLFKGFSPESIQFLIDIKENNSRQWFENNRDNYEQFILDPFRNLVTDLGPDMLKIDIGFEVRPQINKTISKIYRDTRFSKDKTIFKNRVWLTFKKLSDDWKDHPAYFFELMTDSYRYGLGYYSASKATMDCFRASIADNRKQFEKAIAFLNNGSEFELKGDLYKRSLESDYPEKIQTWYQRKSFYIVCTRKIDKLLYSYKLKDVIQSGFNKLAPLYNYLDKFAGH